MTADLHVDTVRCAVLWFPVRASCCSCCGDGAETINSLIATDAYCVISPTASLTSVYDHHITFPAAAAAASAAPCSTPTHVHLCTDSLTVPGSNCVAGMGTGCYGELNSNQELVSVR